MEKRLSIILKLNETGQYFQVEFGLLNNIEYIDFVKDKKKATIFKEESKNRLRELSSFLNRQGIKKEDITIEISH